ncbi:T9SS type A sorting domain-containing protein [Kordia jejudonensis]|uniref:T9SS type A sorting domain-containing protein n=1 Tax=Kordia jejudonensis TaxID=1348245 RepID=UPI00138DE76C|nr:T9SS type A sorting domain-containing protein [Kordia jejudonensis]
MKKLLLASLFCFFLFCVNAQCTIAPFIQQNYDIDARILALREIRSDVNDIDYDNPFVPEARVNPYLEQLSAIYNNPQNSPEIDSLFNEFQFRVNPVYSYVDYTEYKSLVFTVNTTVSWVQTFKDTGVSGITELDNLMSQYQLTISSFYDFNSSGSTAFFLTTGFDFLNIRALIDDFEIIPNIIYAEPYNTYANPLGLNYTGVPYSIVLPVLPSGTQNYSVAVCDITVNGNGIYEFWLYGGDCFSGCQASEARYVSISNDCNTVNFSRTLSTEEVELTTVSIYPNPTTDFLQVQGITNIKNLEVYTIQGKNINISFTNTDKIDVSSLQSGIYFLKVMDAQNRIAIRKFIKQ